MMWAIMVTIIEMKWPSMSIHNYPKVLQDIIKLPPIKNEKIGKLFRLISLLVIVIFVFWSVIYTYLLNTVSYFTILVHTGIVFMSWNIFDLLIIDWLIFCILQPKYIVLPGSEGNKAYKDYMFHFICFLKGCIISLMGSIIIAGIIYMVLNFIIWKLV
jgi:hypothetical protein